MSIKIQVIFYSMYGHVYRMAEAVAEGAKQVPGAEVSLSQVPELTPDDVLEKHGARAARASFAKRPTANPASFTWLRSAAEAPTGLRPSRGQKAPATPPRRSKNAPDFANEGTAEP